MGEGERECGLLVDLRKQEGRASTVRRMNYPEVTSLFVDTDRFSPFASSN